MKRGDVFGLIAAIAVCGIVAIIGSAFTIPSIPVWYAGLAKPELAPPNWIFSPVWTILFILMGIAVFFVWRQGMGRSDVKIALSVFVIQLILNVLWSVIFFGLRNPFVAFVEIIFLWIAIFATIIAFLKISKPAAWLLVPYILWVSFASYLNFAIWRLNL